MISNFKSDSPDAKRDYQLDNVRVLLIYLVVFAHLLETIKGNDVTTGINKCIYTFHMPAMLFLSGYFARYRPAAILRKILFPYVLFQIIYRFFDSFIWNDNATLVLRFTRPYWLLWYLLALFIYNLILPLFQTDDWHAAFRRLIVCVLLSLLAGFDKKIGYEMSLSRILVFLPFFAAGHYCASFYFRSLIVRYKRMIVVCTGATIIALEVLFISLQVQAEVFYGSYSYESSNSNILIRFLFLLCAFLWIIFLLSVMTHRRLPVLTGIGQRTFTIYLLHGFFQRMIISMQLLRGEPFQNLMWAAVLAAVMTGVLSLKLLNSLFTKLFSQSRKTKTDSSQKDGIT